MADKASQLASAADTASELVILRYSGELSTKARETRRRFLTLLLRNVREALLANGIEAAIQRFHERAFIAPGSRQSLAVAARVFGVQSAALAHTFPAAGLEETVARCRDIFAPLVRGKRFAVRARIVGSKRSVTWSSVELERTLGAALVPDASGVDLREPQFTAAVEIHRERGFAVVEHAAGAAGLPLGSEGRALALLSGGFDSAAAAWQLMRRGVRIDYVFCNLGGEEHARGALRVARALHDRWGYGTDPRLVLLDFDAIVSAIRAHTRPRYWQILLKRFMLRAAEAIAREERIDALVTGEAVGQVSSQTLRNLAVTSEVVERPVLRPLAGMNKEDIIALTRRIGTYALSEKVAEHCALDASDPTTAARSRLAAEYENALPKGLLEEALAAAQLLRVRDLHVDSEREVPEATVEHPIPGSIILDLRPRAQFDGDHLPGARYLPWDQALRAYPSFDTGQDYTICCEYGLLSAELVRRMRALGMRCAHLRGGMRGRRARAS